MNTSRGSEEVLGKGLPIGIYQQHLFTIICGIGPVDNTIHRPLKEISAEKHKVHASMAILCIVGACVHAKYHFSNPEHQSNHSTRCCWLEASLASAVVFLLFLSITQLTVRIGTVYCFA